MPILICGPTASGKSALAVEVARRLGGAVVNGDPFQAIEGLGIGTGQPSEAERGGVAHVGYGLLAPSYRPNPAEFGRRVRGWVEASAHPVLVTGSGLYLRGIWEQLDELPEVPEALVQRVRAWGRSLGVPPLHRYLGALDPVRAAELHPNDGARVQRALALHLATGLRPSRLLSGVHPAPPEGWRVLVVLPEREAQRQRVARRVRAQVEEGWPREVEGLVEAGHGEDLRALRPLGYEVWMEGGDPGALEARIVHQTQAYAKRQSTWFRNQLPEAPRWDPDRELLGAALERLGLPSES